ncbi:MAG: four helix bundle protein, partial [Bacteroidetes bacterium]|nr:four helix bundle protein [Bacteroidota bacterium]
PMFDFERLEVYQVIRELNNTVFTLLYRLPDIDSEIKEQWKKSSLNIQVNLAEGTGRMSIEEKKTYIALARGSVNISVALLHVVKDLGQVGEDDFKTLYGEYEQASKMLLGMYRSFVSQ